MPLDKWQGDRYEPDGNLSRRPPGKFKQLRCIINIASIDDRLGEHVALGGHAASKAGMSTDARAADVARSGIRVNAIAPGYFHSRLADPAIVRRAADQGDQPDPRGNPGSSKASRILPPMPPATSPTVHRRRCGRTIAS
jgi:NAD(P)-dependent dehydrogenase (short-subunit alcohol dehydrogenase family)